MAQKRKIMIMGPQARKKVQAGVDFLADAVKLTLGPYGRNFASGVRGGPVTISNDGVSLAKEIQGRDEFEDLGVRAVREAATKTNDKAGDGTTTAVVLTQAMLKTTKFDSDAFGKKASLADIERMRRESEDVVRLLNAMAEPIETLEELIAVARVSVEDEKLASLVGVAQWEVGRDGTVLAEEHNEPEDRVEYIYGVRLDNGYGTSRIANNQEKQALELADMPVIVTNKIFNTADTIRALIPIFDKLIADGKTTGVVLVGRAFDETAIGLCVKNIQMYAEGKGGLPVFPINAPYTDMDEVMEDLAAALGARYIQDAERNLESLTLKDVGFASKVFCKRYEGIIAGRQRGEDAYVDERVDERVLKIKEKLKGEVTPFETRQLSARLAQLTAGTAVIKVGAETEQERKYKKDKVDDAVNTVKAAMLEGVLPGAGEALARIADHLEAEPGGSMLAEALRAPRKQIMANAGGAFAVPVWVQDPLLVVRTAFEKASSIARSLATTEVAVTWEEEKPMWVQQADINKTSEEDMEE